MDSRRPRQSRNKRLLHKGGRSVRGKPVASGVCGQYSRLALATHLLELQEQREPVTSKRDCITTRSIAKLVWTSEHLPQRTQRTQRKKTSCFSAHSAFSAVNICALTGGFLSAGLVGKNADIGQVAVAFREVQAIADHEFVGDDKPHVVRSHRHYPA